MYMALYHRLVKKTFRNSCHTTGVAVLTYLAGLVSVHTAGPSFQEAGEAGLLPHIPVAQGGQMEVPASAVHPLSLTPCEL